MKIDVASSNISSIERMKAAEIKYIDYNSTKSWTRIIPWAVLGLFVGGITFLKINTMELGSIFVAMLVAALTSLAGAAGKLLFDKLLKKPLSKLIDRFMQMFKRSPKPVPTQVVLFSRDKTQLLNKKQKPLIMIKSPFIIGLLSALLIALQQFIGQPTVDWKVMGLAALIGVLGFVGNFLKGKGISILGAIGTAVYTFVQVWQTGHFTWSEFALTAAIAILTLFTQSAVAKQPTDQ